MGWENILHQFFPVFPQLFGIKIAVGKTDLRIHDIAVGLMGRNQEDIAGNQGNLDSAECVHTGAFCDQYKFLETVGVFRNDRMTFIFCSLNSDGGIL